MILETLDAYCLRWILALLHFVWQGSLIAGVALIAGRWFRKPEDRYTLNMLAMLAFPLCVVVTFTIVDPELDLVLRVVSDQPAQWTELTETNTGWVAEDSPAGEGSSETSSEDRPDSRSSSTSEVLMTRRAEVDRRPDLAGDGDTIEHATTPTVAARSADESLGVASIAMGFYLCMAVVFLSRLGFAVAGGNRLRRTAIPVEDRGLLELLSQECRLLRFKLEPALAYSENVLVPTVVGVLRPLILLPTGLVSNLDAEQVAAILRHELAHIRRYDLPMNLLQRVIESLLFFHPAVWMVTRRMRMERELCCDDLVIAFGKDRMDYARALLETAEACQLRGRQVVGLAASGDDSNQLERRILRLLSEQPPSHSRLTRGGMLGFGLLLVSAVLAPAAIHAWQNAPGEDEARSDELLTTSTAPTTTPTTTDEEKTKASAANAKSKGPEFRGLKLSQYAATTEPLQLRGLYHESPKGSGKFSWLPSTCFMPFDGPFSVLYVADRSHYFVRHEIEPKLVYYGPIQGDPLKQLKIESYLKERLREKGTMGNARLTVARMIRSGNTRLAGIGLKLLNEVLSNPDALDDISNRRRSSRQAEQCLNFALDMRKSYPATLRQFPNQWASLDASMKRMEQAFNAAMKTRPPENYTDATYLQKKIPSHAPVQWGPENNGLRLGIVGKTPISVKHGEQLYPFELLLQNVSSEDIVFQVGYAAEWLRAKVVGADGKEVRTEFGDVGSSLHPFTSYWRLKPGEMYHVCGNRLTFAAPQTKLKTTAFRRMDWLITRVRATPGNYTARYMLPLNQWRTRRGKGEWHGTLVSSPFKIRLAAADGVDDEAPAAKEPPKAAQQPLTKNANGRYVIRYDKAPVMQIAQDYAAAVDYSISFEVKPEGTVSYQNRRPYEFTAYRHFVMLEVLRAGYYLDNGKTEKSFILRRVEDVASDRAEVFKQSKLFEGDLELLDYRPYLVQQPNAPEGPAFIYKLRAKRDLSANRVTSLLRARFSDKLSMYRGSDRMRIHCDTYAVRFGGNLLYGKSPAFKKGESFEVFHNEAAVEWNPFDPNPPIATISGRITDSAGMPIAGLHAEYMVFGDFRFDRPIGGKLELDKDGNYTVPIRAGGWLMSPSKFYVIANGRGLAPVQIESKPIKKGQDQRLDVKLDEGFDGNLELDTGGGPQPLNGILELQAFDLRHSKLFNLRFEGRSIRVPHCGKLPFIITAKVPGFEQQTFRDVRFVKGQITRLKLKAKSSGAAAQKEPGTKGNDKAADKKAEKTTDKDKAAGQKAGKGSTADSRPNLDQPVLKLPDYLNVQDVAYSKFGEKIISVATESKVSLRTWDSISGELLSEVSLETEKHGNFFLNGTLRLSGNGKLVVAVVAGKVQLWDAKSGKPVPLELPPDYRASKVAISRDGTKLATAGAIGFGRINPDVPVNVWDVKSGKSIHKLIHTGGLQIHDLALSADGSLLASASQENGVFVWNLSDGKRKHHLLHDPLNARLKHPRGPLSPVAKRQVLALAFDPDGSRLAATDMFGVKLWNMEQGKLLHALDAPFRFGRSRVRFSRTGKYLARAAADKEVVIWSAADGKVQQKLKTESGCIAFSPRTTHVAVGFSDRKYALAVWQLDTSGE